MTCSSIVAIHPMGGLTGDMGFGSTEPRARVLTNNERYFEMSKTLVCRRALQGPNPHKNTGAMPALKEFKAYPAPVFCVYH